MRSGRSATSLTVETVKPSEFSLAECYSKAWSAFSKWWIPLCFLSGALMLFECAPKHLVRAEIPALIQSGTQVFNAIEQDDFILAETILIELNDSLYTYVKAAAVWTLYATPIIAILTIVLLCTSIMAVKDQRIRYSPWRLLWVSFLNILVAFMKVLLLFLFLPLGIYIYIKLYFVCLVMVDEQQGLRGAIKRSWKLSSGHFWPLLGMVALNGTFQMIMIPTIIGLIPASGFANTARAAAFELLRNHFLDAE